MVNADVPPDVWKVSDLRKDHHLLGATSLKLPGCETS